MTRRSHHRELPTDARVTSGILCTGAIGFGALGIVAPARLARMMGATDETARAIGVRDVGNALAFVVAPTSAAALQRMLFDLGDAFEFGRRKPRVATAALSFAVLAGWTAWRAR